MATTITRATIFDNSTAWNSATISSVIYDKIDQMFAGGVGYTTFDFGGAVRVNGTFSPTSPTATLGTTALPWSDLYLATGGIINFANGDVLQTHSTDTLTWSGATLYDFQTGRIKGASTISVGGATPSTSGAGISFPATQSASSDANTLDDYEEGTFTPTLTGTWTTLPTNLAGTYNKIGRLVHVALQWRGGVKSGATTGAFASLPFSQNASTYGVGAVVNTEGVAQGSCIITGTTVYVTTNTFTAGIDTIANLVYFV